MDIKKFFGFGQQDQPAPVAALDEPAPIQQVPVRRGEPARRRRPFEAPGGRVLSQAEPARRRRPFEAPGGRMLSQHDLWILAAQGMSLEAIRRLHGPAGFRAAL